MQSSKSQTLLTTAQKLAGSPHVKPDHLVCGDAGHGGHDPGATSTIFKLTEKTLALDICTRTLRNIRLFTKRTDKESPSRVETVSTRFTDTFVPIDHRPFVAKQFGADMFLSFHVNSSVNILAQGAECWISDGSKAYREESNRLSELILQRLCDCGFRSRGIKGDSVNRHKRLGVLRGFDTTGPGVLVELGFLTNSHDAKLLKTPTGREVIGAGIAMAVCEFYGIKPRIDLYYA